MSVTVVDDLQDELESYRHELTGYCYRMLGAASEAEDAVQETMIRAWRSLDRFEGRSSLRSWLYRIANNVCIDMHRSPQRRARPMPYDLWLQGPDDLVAWLLGQGSGCRGGRLIPIVANGTAAFGNYRPAGAGRWEPFAIQVIEVAGGRIVGHHNFLHPERFAEFGLPPFIEHVDRLRTVSHAQRSDG